MYLDHNLKAGPVVGPEKIGTRTVRSSAARTPFSTWAGEIPVGPAVFQQTGETASRPTI